MAIDRVYIKCGGNLLETFRAFRAWAEKVAAERGETLDPGWYRDGPEDMPELYDSVPEAEAGGIGGDADREGDS